MIVNKMMGSYYINMTLHRFNGADERNQKYIDYLLKHDIIIYEEDLINIGLEDQDHKYCVYVNDLLKKGIAVDIEVLKRVLIFRDDIDYVKIIENYKFDLTDRFDRENLFILVGNSYSSPFENEIFYYVYGIIDLKYFIEYPLYFELFWNRGLTKDIYDLNPLGFVKYCKKNGVDYKLCIEKNIGRTELDKLKKEEYNEKIFY